MHALFLRSELPKHPSRQANQRDAASSTVLSGSRLIFIFQMFRYFCARFFILSDYLWPQGPTPDHLTSCKHLPPALLSMHRLASRQQATRWRYFTWEHSCHPDPFLAPTRALLVSFLKLPSAPRRTQWPGNPNSALVN